MYLRTQEEHLGQGPASVVKGVQTALEAYKKLEDIRLVLGGGGVTFKSNNARYIRSDSLPGRKVLQCTRLFRIVIFEPPAPFMRFSIPGSPYKIPPVRRDSFLFKLEYQYDGNNLIWVGIRPEEKGSSTLRKAKFDINFDSQDITIPHAPVGVIRYFIHGTWEPWNPDPFSSEKRFLFTGELDVRTDGSASLAVRSSSGRVLADPMTNSCTVVAPYVPKAPVRKYYSLRPPILFPLNGSKVSDNDAQRIYAWKDSWPSTTQGKVKRGEIRVNVQGFASRPGKGLYNLELSERRANNVAHILRGATGAPKDAASVEWSGKYKQNLPGLFDVIEWLRRSVNPNKYDQAVVIWFEDVE